MDKKTSAIKKTSVNKSEDTKIKRQIYYHCLKSAKPVSNPAHIGKR